ncbi:hypothetical protein [Myceligenerans xiligouense]|uniref:DUF4352 domain-containing protein n=1 Tax=Myceligenerans xiligouense TaxID=253184 RepID=A0A3N4ZBC8_9MICO|nr:hypothetical protein [Myceligenerans xiligouense]RPF22762.1 hypothetical protein EDD34_3434 [Myceligenerans xiligouense]
MTSFSRTRGSRKGLRTGTVALHVTAVLVLSTTLAACGPAEQRSDGDQPSAGATSAPRDPAASEPGSSSKASPASDGAAADDAEDSGTSSGEADDTIVAGRATTGVVPLTSGPVAVGEAPDHDLSVKLGAIERTEAEPSMPGEIAGPAIRVEVAVSNAGGTYHALGASVVNLYYGPDRIPASSLSGSGQEDLPDSVPGGQTVTGTYEFTVPDDRSGRVLVEIDVDPQLHVALFEGELSL